MCVVLSDNLVVVLLTTHSPTHSQVFSVSGYERHTLEGCGYTHLPLLATGLEGSEGEGGGSYSVDVDVSTWKPIGSRRTRPACLPVVAVAVVACPSSALTCLPALFAPSPS